MILQGTFRVYIVQNGQQKTLLHVGPGGMTGLLPYSRMKSAPVYSDSNEEVIALSLSKSKFRDMICHQPELTEVFVHALIDRARQFTGLHFQNEKLMALGKLSAGLSHELNNPAAAILRSAEDLKQTIGSIASDFETLGALHLTEEEIPRLRPIIAKIDVRSQSLALIERLEKEDAFSEWSSDHDVPTECVEVLVETPIARADLDAIAGIITDNRLPLLIRWLSDNIRAARIANEIAMASRRVSDLVKSIKNYTRMDQVHDMQPVEINEGIRNTLMILQHKVRQNNVTVREELAAGLPPITGFPGELNQVWTNLIDNALDAMKSGGELHLQTAAAPDQVTFSVTDTGGGIPPENLERIFDPFFTTKDIGEGTGVGLDVVQKVIQLHKGRIDVKSKPGKTEFTISFPRA
jgi:signal transduction histidine kinase